MYGDNNRTELINGKYRVLGVLGEGGFANVYRVSDEHIGKEYAMKVFKKNSDENFREIEVLRRLEHKGLPTLHDVVTNEGYVYVVMELVKGVTLKEYVEERGNLGVKETVRIAIEMCEIIGYLHRRLQPVIHGDLKPGNIMIGDEEVCLVDFGGALIQQDMPDVIYATPGYAAPELKRGELYTQSDVYSFGKVIEFMLTGREAFEHSENSGKRELKKYGVPAGLRKIVTKCTMEAEELRYQSGKELMDALQNNKNVTAQLPGHVIYVSAMIFRGLGALFYIACLCFYKIEMQANLPEFFIMAGVILLIGIFMNKIAERYYKTAILECECSIVVSGWDGRTKSFL